MKQRSFRLRIALWSALLSGLALLSFALVVDWQMRHDKIEALDRAIRLYSEREAAHPSPPPDYWQHIEENLHDLFAQGDSNAVVLWVQSQNGLNYQSAHWSPELDINALPWSKLPASPHATRPPPPPDAFMDEFMADRPHPPPHFPPHAPPSTLISEQVTPHTVWHFGLIATPFVRLAIGVDMRVIDGEIARIRSAFLVALPLTLLLIGIGSVILSSRALSPLKRLTNTMQQITAKGLHQRLAAGSEDQEFSELIKVFNAMLERLERGFLQASRFSADAAHELKTPLAILQGQIEQTMSQVAAGSALQIRLSSILDEIQRLSTISRKLLLLSLADAGRLRLHKVNFNLSQALEELIEDAQMLAPDLDVAGTIAPNLFIEADADLLRQVLHNLLSNAIKYNIPAGLIDIAATRQQQRIKVSITNTSPASHRLDPTRLFERFYRADSAHGRQIEGLGLGLSLAREIALAHGGDLALAKAESGEVQFLLMFYKPCHGVYSPVTSTPNSSNTRPTVSSTITASESDLL